MRTAPIWDNLIVPKVGPSRSLQGELCNAGLGILVQPLVKIAYIAGCARSGTTLLARLLGEIPNFVSVGEAGAYFLGHRDPSKALHRCGCGAEMSECSLWSKMKIDPNLRILGRPFTRSGYTHRALWWQSDAHTDLQRFLEAASAFYHTLAAMTGAKVIVDSSKGAGFAALLSRAPGIQVYAIHLIRDLRGVVSSWRRPKGYIPAISVGRSVLRWYWNNVGAGFLEKRTTGFSRLRYEDFVAHPNPTLDQLGSAIIGFPVSCPFLSDGQAQVRPQHHAGGNPDKFQSGEILLRERKAQLGPVMKSVVSLAGAPLLMRYGYFSKGRNGGLSQADPLTLVSTLQPK
jgi:hypothetical protein